MFWLKLWCNQAKPFCSYTQDMAKARTWIKHIDLDELRKLVKDHIKPALDPVENPKLWHHIEMDYIVANYEDFLAAFAAQGLYFHQKKLHAVLRQLFAGDPKVLYEFATVMDKALKYTKNKARSVKSGSKTCPPVLRVARTWTRQSSSQSLTTARAEEEDSDLQIEDSSTSGPTELSEAVDAQKSLADAQQMFGSGATRALKRQASIFSVASSEGELFAPGAPKASKPNAKKAQLTTVPKVLFLYQQKNTIRDNPAFP